MIIFCQSENILSIFIKTFLLKICDSISTQVGHVFGRRADPIEISMTGGCCHGDLCNHHKLTPVAMSTNPPMTTVPTIPTTTAKSKRKQNVQ